MHTAYNPYTRSLVFLTFVWEFYQKKEHMRRIWDVFYWIYNNFEILQTCNSWWISNFSHYCDHCFLHAIIEFQKAVLVGQQSKFGLKIRVYRCPPTTIQNLTSWVNVCSKVHYIIDSLCLVKGALNPNSFNLTINREKFWL